MTRREPRWWFVVYAVGLGVLVAGAEALGGRPIRALFVVPLFLLAGLAMSYTPWGTLRARSQDERERSVSQEAMAISGSVLTGVVVTGFIVQLARGADTALWSFLCFVGGMSYVIGLALADRRRR